MSRVRFATARALFETFPKSVTNIAAAPTDEPPVLFLRKLATAEKVEDAVTFCAYLLPRREAVWWACGCARTLLGEIAHSQAACLLAAEAWVSEPDDQHRQAALELGMQSDSNDPLTWLALGAGWSGGMLSSHPQMSALVPPFMTARAARIAVQLSAHFAKKKNELPAHLQACIAEGIKLAETGL
jgi:hypothetical protein